MGFAGAGGGPLSAPTEFDSPPSWSFSSSGFLQPHHCLVLAPRPESNCRGTQQAQIWQERGRGRAGKRGLKKIDGGIVVMATAGWAGGPIAGRSSSSSSCIPEPWRRAKDLGRVPENTSGTSRWQPVRGEFLGPKMLFWQHWLNQGALRENLSKHLNWRTEKLRLERRVVRIHISWAPTMYLVISFSF